MKSVIMLGILILLLCSGLYGCNDITRLLCEHNVIQHGNFTLRNGTRSNFYIDMRRLFADAQAFQEVGNCALADISPDSYDAVCGVPYGAVPLATLIYLETKKPLLLLRKETKAYGTQKLVEGCWKRGDRVLLVEDVMTTGQSVLTAAQQLESQGLTISQIIAVVDRQEGGTALLTEKYKVSALTTLHNLISFKKF